MSHEFKLQPEDFVLEQNWEHKRLDCLVPCVKTAFEFKYDRKRLTGKKGGKSGRAGALLKDFFRLSRYKNADKKYMVYLTDGLMRSYFKNSALSFLLDTKGRKLVLKRHNCNKLCRTVKTHMGVATDCKAEIVYSNDALPAQHCLRIYLVTKC